MKKFIYKDYIETSNKLPSNDINDDASVSADEEMGGSVLGMRLEFKKTTRRLIRLYAIKKLRRAKYKIAKSHGNL